MLRQAEPPARCTAARQRCPTGPMPTAGIQLLASATAIFSAPDARALLTVEGLYRFRVCDTPTIAGPTTFLDPLCFPLHFDGRVGLPLRPRLGMRRASAPKFVVSMFGRQLRRGTQTRPTCKARPLTQLSTAACACASLR